MAKTILITGSTDGIGYETARALLAQGHRVLIHGRSPQKVSRTGERLAELGYANRIELFTADLSELSQVYGLATDIAARIDTLDVLINNAGIFKTPHTLAKNGIDVRFMVNTVAPWLLTQQLQGVFAPEARIINLSSAAQAPVNLAALRGEQHIAEDFEVYAQSKLALTMWSMAPSAVTLLPSQAIVAVNPGSMLGSKMVKEGFGSQGKDLAIGVEILSRMATEADMTRSWQYFDNDRGHYAEPHPDARNADAQRALLAAMQAVVAKG